MKQKKWKIFKITAIFLSILLLIVLFLSIFIKKEFGDISFEQIIYNIKNSKGANYSIVIDGIKFISCRIFIIVIITYISYIIFKNLKSKTNIETNVKKIFLTSLIAIIYFGSLIIYKSFDILNINEYIISQQSSSKIFEDHYVDASETELEFPKEKRNLIYIFAESMESTNVSKENGGITEESYIPNLEKLALNNINFSNTDKIGGAIQLNNTSWTIAGLISQTAGTPLKVTIDANSYTGYSQSLPGVYSLGDILKKNGYNNYFMIGSKAEFGGRKDYFEQHGDYTIYDYNYAKDTKLIESDYYVWWGYEDQKLFENAKDKILKAAEKEELFNFTLLTVDTHCTDGYMDNSCEQVFEEKYANAFYCSDQKIASFVNWIMEQDFYENTTIIISGDHLTMQHDFYDRFNIEENNYQRTIYNVIINSPIEPINEKNRLFSSFDMFPTTLASLGVKIKGNKLGLGVNLFSEEQTLLEKYGREYMNSEISKKSFYYDNVILANTYYEMQEEIENETTALKTE